jgi:MFS transporter, DHA1 family, tetracycline resistance protein
MASDASLDYTIPDPQPFQPPKGALAAIFLIVLSDLLGFGLIIPALPLYAKQLDASYLQIGLVFSIFSLCQLFATPVLGMASDRFGRRPILLFSQIGSAAGYVLLTVAMAKIWQPAWMALAMIYASRVIDGVSGGNISTAQAYVSDVTTPENRAKGMGMLGAAFGIGFSLGPAVGGILGHWHPALPAAAAAAFSGLAAVLTGIYLKEPMRHRPTEETEAWLHPSRFKPILKSPLLVQMLGISLFSMIAFVMLESIFAIFLAERYGFGMLAVGLFFMWIGFVITLVQGGLIGRLARRFGEWPLVILGPFLVGAAMLVYVAIGIWPIPVGLGIGLILLAGTFNAGGRSIQTPALSALLSRATDDRLQGTVFGLFHMLGSLGRVIGPMIATALYAWHPTTPFLLAAGIMALMSLWSMLLRLSARTEPEVLTV